MNNSIYIDPGSYSSGYAVFCGNRLISSGTVKMDGKDGWERLRTLYLQYYDIGKEFKPKEVYIEQLVRNTHIFTHYSCAVIGVALKRYSPIIRANISIKSWQKYVGWNSGRRKLKAYAAKVSSEDELAAIGMGIFHTNKGNIDGK